MKLVRLKRDIKKYAKQEKVSMREVARRAKITHTTMWRIMGGDDVSLKSLVGLMKVLGTGPDRYIP